MNQPKARTSPLHLRQAECRASLCMSGQLLVAQAALMSMPVMDVAMTAPLGLQAVAACGLVNSVAALWMLFCFGVMQAIAPLAGKASDGASLKTVHSLLGPGLIIASVIGLLAALTLLLLSPALTLMGHPPDVKLAVQHYAPSLAPAMLPAAWISTWRVVLPIVGQAWSLALALPGGAVLHALLNRLLLDGTDRLPSFGLTGLGLSYCLTYGFVALVIGLIYRRVSMTARGAARRKAGSREAKVAPRLAPTRELLSLGLPIGGVVAIEYTLLTGSTLLMARQGSVALAAHTVVLQWVTLVFVIPLVISHTLLTLLSLSLARAGAAEVRRTVANACASAVVFHALVAAMFLLFPDTLVDLLLPSGNTVDRETLRRTTGPLMQVAALLQALNGMAVILAAILRAFRDTQAPMWQVFAGYWLVGFGGVLVLGRVAGAVGIWWGMTLGFGLTIGLLQHRVRRRLRDLNDQVYSLEASHAQSR